MTKDMRDYEEYVASRWANLVRAATFLGCNVPEAQDLAQTALLKCYLSWTKVRRAEDVDAYVYKVMINTFRDSRRRHWLREIPSPAASTIGGTIQDSSERVAMVDAVDRALADLPTANREVLVLRYLAGLGEKQTASALGVPVGTVKSRAARALAELANSEHIAAYSKGTGT